MRARREGLKFHLEIDHTELLVLFTVIEEERVSVGLQQFQFHDPNKVREILRKYHKEIAKLIKTRTEEEVAQKFFK